MSRSTETRHLIPSDQYDHQENPSGYPYITVLSGELEGRTFYLPRGDSWIDWTQPLTVFHKVTGSLFKNRSYSLKQGDVTVDLCDGVRCTVDA